MAKDLRDLDPTRYDALLGALLAKTPLTDLATAIRSAPAFAWSPSTLGLIAAPMGRTLALRAVLRARAPPVPTLPCAARRRPSPARRRPSWRSYRPSSSRRAARRNGALRNLQRRRRAPPPFVRLGERLVQLNHDAVGPQVELVPVFASTRSTTPVALCCLLSPVCGSSRRKLTVTWLPTAGASEDITLMPVRLVSCPMASALREALRREPEREPERPAFADSSLHAHTLRRVARRGPVSSVTRGRWAQTPGSRPAPARGASSPASGSCAP